MASSRRSMNPTRSSAVEERLALAHGGVDDGHDQLVEHHAGARDDVEVAVRDRVVGPGADGDAVIGAMDADEGVAVAAFVFEGQVERQRRPAIALGDHERAGRQHRWQRLRQLAPEALRQAVWRVEEDEIVLTSLPRCRAEEPQSVAAAHLAPRLRAPRGWPSRPPPRPPRSPRTSPPRRRARAPRARAHPSLRTGRAPARPARDRPGSRTAPRARGPRSAGWRAPFGAVRRRPPQRPATILTSGAASR